MNAVFLNKSLPKITNRKLKIILTHSCKSEKNFSYDSKKILYDQLKNQDVSAHTLANEILTVSNNGLKLDFVLNLIFEHLKGCPECHQGIMKKPNPIHTYDYNKDGWIPSYCSNCGCGYSEHIITFESNGMMFRGN